VSDCSNGDRNGDDNGDMPIDANIAGGKTDNFGG
jgi:hypothetical protein